MAKDKMKSIYNSSKDEDKNKKLSPLYNWLRSWKIFNLLGLMDEKRNKK